MKIDFDNTKGRFMKGDGFLENHLILQNEFEDSFEGAKSVKVIFEEIPSNWIGKEEYEPIEIKNKNITINIKEHKYQDKKGNFTIIPTSEDVLNSCRRLLIKASKDFKNLSKNQEEE
ncbi:MAG: hypothetical protein HKN86_05445 [Acidimicrobiia bacterium]|nr:hypothetical protein [Acidimicrobiia bacterium]